jgi:hypothetical protein
MRFDAWKYVVVVKAECAVSLTVCLRPYTVRVARAGEMRAARREGCHAAARPTTHITATPPTM